MQEAGSFPLAQANSILSDDFRLTPIPPERKDTIPLQLFGEYRGSRPQALGERQCNIVGKHMDPLRSKYWLCHLFSIRSWPIS